MSEALLSSDTEISRPENTFDSQYYCKVLLHHYGIQHSHRALKDWQNPESPGHAPMKRKTWLHKNEKEIAISVTVLDDENKEHD
jgi:hypothetical protein